MPFTNAWSDVIPAGSAAANTIDDQIRQLRLDIHERMDSLIDDWTADPLVPLNAVAEAVRVSRAAAMNITTSVSTFTAIEWDTEAYDTAAIHDLVTNPTRLTIPAATTGTKLIRIYGQVTIDIPLDSARVYVRIKKNGTEIARALNMRDSGASAPFSCNIYIEDRGVATNYYELEAMQDAGSDQALNTGSTLTFFGLSIQ